MQCRKCGFENPAGTAFCISCGHHFGSLTRGDTATATATTVPPAHSQSTHSPRGRHWANLTAIDKKGQDGSRYPVTGNDTTIGSGIAATISFPHDAFIARSHVRLTEVQDGATLTPLDSWNGIFVRVEGSIAIADEQEFLIGRQVFRLQKSHPTSPAPLVRHGVSLFASPAVAAWGRVIHLHANGDYGDVRILTGAEITFGREEGEIRFPKDAFLSRIHAMLRKDGSGEVALCDLKSSNGTYIKFTRAVTLPFGAVFRVGDQLFRVDR